MKTAPRTAGRSLPSGLAAWRSGALVDASVRGARARVRAVSEGRAVAPARPPPGGGGGGADGPWDPGNGDGGGGGGGRGGPPARSLQTDFLVVGSGIAGLSYALEVAERGSVTIVTKASASEGCTQYAQGGVAAVLSPLDSVADHVRDTHAAGCFLNDPAVVDAVCREGAERVLALAGLGAEFSRARDGGLHLVREGGHSHRRIAHRGDTSGAAIEQALLAAVRAHPGITVLEHCSALDLRLSAAAGAGDRPASPVCVGAHVYDTRQRQPVEVSARTTMLASGGAGRVYPRTTNPAVATGDGVAMAFRAGAQVANMEFVQFHPTGLYLEPGTGAVDVEGGGAPRTFLISEALRGEGAVLRNLAGERFMQDADERAELAPRDVVARAIHSQIVAEGDPHVWLDISHLPRNKVLRSFPAIAAHCLQQGVDITSEAIPIAPTQHYFCGGVKTGLRGETSVPGLFACGEVACTGLHGANRLASNSLLEGLVFGHRAARAAVAHARRAPIEAALGSAAGPGCPRIVSPDPHELRMLRTVQDGMHTTMWQHAGIVRSSRGLASAMEELNALSHNLSGAFTGGEHSLEALEVENLLTVAQLVLACAARRKESRGLHFTRDYVHAKDSEKRDTVLSSSDVDLQLTRAMPELVSR